MQPSGGQVAIFTERLDDFLPFYGRCEEDLGLLGTLDSLFLVDLCQPSVLSSCPFRRPGERLLIANNARKVHFQLWYVLSVSMTRNNDVK